MAISCESLVPPPYLRKLSLWLACGSAVAILISIGISQILLALALGVLLLSGLPLEWPRIVWPLALFWIWTFIALAASPDPGFGKAQSSKLFVYLVLLIVYSALRTVREVKGLVLAWIAVGTFTAGRGVVQFINDYLRARAANRDFYHAYVADRITGFMSHWMTFSGQELLVLLLAAAYVLYSPDVRKRWWFAWPCVAVTGIALVMSNTRSVWIAAVVAGSYLLWCWRKWALAALPVALALGLAVAPAAVKTRVRSITNPEKETDSNQHRIICWRTGWNMIKAHPITGVGPDEINKAEVFFAYLPADVQEPLPDGFYGHLHNIYIQYAAERGIPATLFLTAALLLALFDFRRALGRLPAGRSDVRFLLHGAIACIIGIMVAGIAEYNLNDTEVLTMFLALMCVGYRAVQHA
jgi:O-antigen ligase